MFKNRYMGFLQLALTSVLCLILMFNGKLQFQSDLMALLPAQSQSRAADAEAHFFEQYRHSLMLSFSKEGAQQAHDDMQAWFNEHDITVTKRAVPTLPELAEFYGPYQGAVLSKQLKMQIESGRESILERQILGYLSGSFNPLQDAFFGVDPSLTTASFVEEAIRQNQGNFSIEASRLVLTVDSQSHYVLIAQLTLEQQPLFIQQQVINNVQAQIAYLQQAYPGIEVRYSGVPFHNVENAQQAHLEMSLFGTLSLLGLILLVWCFFRSLNALAAASICLLNALVYALLAVMIWFEHVHVISFVFAITLIGIAIDYCFHVIVASRESKREQRSVQHGIVFGLLSTILGYSAFVFMPLVFLKQVAVFVSFGLLGAAACALTVLPQYRCFVMNTARAQGIGEHLARQFNNKRRALSIIWGSTVVLLVSAVLIAPPSFTDSLQLFSTSSHTLIENERVHNQWLYGTQSQRVLIQASSDQQLLVREARILETLNAHYPSVVTQGLTQWVPSIEAQKANQQILLNASSSGFSSVQSLLAKPILFQPNQWLTPSVILDSAIGAVIQPHYVQLSNGVAGLVQMQGISAQQLDAVLQAHDYAYRIDKQQQLKDVMQLAREKLMLWLVIAVALFALVVAVKVDIKASFKTVGVLVSVISIALLGSAYILGTLNIFNILAMLLILALAIDYFVFYIHRGLVALNVMAITLSALSSMLVFGMLIFSKTPAIYSFGLTVMIGIVSIYLLSPFMAKRKK